MERITKPVRKLTSIPELDALGKALDEYERLAAEPPMTIRQLAEDIARTQADLVRRYECDRDAGTGQEEQR
jgi:hypothetical protein